MDMELGSRKKAGTSGLGRKLVLTLLLLFFIPLSAYLLFLEGRGLYENTQTFLWSETQCLILSSTVNTQHGDSYPYVFSVKYRYRAGGREYASTEYSLVYMGSLDDQSAARLSRTYRPKSRTICYVNPSDPAQAVLAHGNPWVALLKLILPLAFLACLTGMLYLTWKKG